MKNKEGNKQLYISSETHKEIKHLATELEISSKELMELVWKKYKKEHNAKYGETPQTK